jgi:predicted transposase YbfD/YdcC
MKSTIAPNLAPASDKASLLPNLNDLLIRLQQVTDRRCRKGLRYQLPWLLLLIVLAKLAGEDRPSGIADWIAGRQEQWRTMLRLCWPKMPHHSTYRRILQYVVNADEIECLVSEILRGMYGVGCSALVAMDGKTLRGTIGPEHPRGEHLLAAYLPEEGIVLSQKAVGEKGNEITQAPSLLQGLDLRGKVVAGDAMHTQREVSAQILAGQGDYLWLAKQNQPTLLGDIELLFNYERRTVVGGMVPEDFETQRTLGKGHGRVEAREITTSSMLAGYSEWPGLQQVFKLQRERTAVKTGKSEVEVVYGLTSLGRQEACPGRLLSLVRSYWGIENGLHNRRDVTFREDSCRMTRGGAGRVMAALNNLAIGLLRRAGYDNIAHARRMCNASLAHTCTLIAACLLT